jgi:hypothetical protein
MADESNDDEGKLAESPAEQTKAVGKATPEKKIADRPHRITIVIGILSPAIAIVAVYLSLNSLHVSREALDLNRRSMEIAQAAYVTATFYSQKQQREREGPVWHVGAELNNTGNTPATLSNIVVRQERGDNQVKPLILRRSPSTIMIGGKESYKLIISDFFPQLDSSPGFRSIIALAPLGVLSLSFDYEDVFNRKRTVSARWNLIYSDGQMFDMTGYRAVEGVTKPR